MGPSELIDKYLKDLLEVDKLLENNSKDNLLLEIRGRIAQLISRLVSLDK